MNDTSQEHKRAVQNCTLYEAGWYKTKLPRFTSKSQSEAGVLPVRNLYACIGQTRHEPFVPGACREISEMPDSPATTLDLDFHLARDG
jgi:hypothetical protein